MTMGASGRDMSICLFGLYGLLHLMFGVPATLSSRTMAMYVPHCVLRCKDAHMLEMENEWSMDFAFPLLSLLKATGSEVAAYNRAKEICRSNELLGACLDSCNSSMERTILRMGLTPWRDICSNLQELREQFPCWRSNVQNLSTTCRVQSLELRDSFEFLTRNDSVSATQKICINLDKLSACSVKQYGLYCGAESEKFIERLFSISREAINSMMKMKYAILPTACSIGPLRRDVYSSELFTLNGASRAYSLFLLLLILYSLSLNLTLYHVPKGGRKIHR